MIRLLGQSLGGVVVDIWYLSSATWRGEEDVWVHLIRSSERVQETQLPGLFAFHFYDFPDRKLCLLPLHYLNGTVTRWEYSARTDGGALTLADGVLHMMAHCGGSDCTTYVDRSGIVGVCLTFLVTDVPNVGPVDPMSIYYYPMPILWDMLGKQTFVRGIYCEADEIN